MHRQFEVVDAENGTIILPLQSATAFGAWYDQMGYACKFVFELVTDSTTFVFIRQ